MTDRLLTAREVAERLGVAATYLLLPEPRPDVTGATSDIFERRVDAALRAQDERRAREAIRRWESYAATVLLAAGRWAA